MVNITAKEDGTVQILVSDFGSLPEVAGAIDSFKERSFLTQEKKAKQIVEWTARRDKLDAAIAEWGTLPTVPGDVVE